MSNKVDYNQILYKNLYNGISIPAICYGTPIININTQNRLKIIKGYIGKILKLKFKEVSSIGKMSKIIKLMRKNNAISLVDTSRAYGASEYIIGKNTCKARDKYFIVTKISNSAQFNNKIREEVEYSLKQLKTNYIDCLLMHWPVKDKFLSTWKEMEKLYKEGLCKSIGVCNCNIHHIEEIKAIAEIKPMINQFECHPLFTQEELRNYCRKEDIQVMAYTATARMDERLKKTCIIDLAKKYNKSIAQIILRWHLQIGNIPIFSTTNKKHYLSNIDIFNFNLTDEEVQAISAINIDSRLRYDPDNCDFKKL